MPETMSRGYRYPSQGAEPDVPGDIQALAEDVSLDVQELYDEVRAVRPFGHMGCQDAFVTVGVNPKPIPFSVAQELKGNMAFSNLEDALVVPVSGMYNVRIKAYFTGNPDGNCQWGMQINGVMGGAAYQGPNGGANKMDGNDISPHSGGRIPLQQGDKVGLWMRGNTSTWGTNGYNGTWLELEYSNPL